MLEAFLLLSLFQRLSLFSSICVAFLCPSYSLFSACWAWPFRTCPFHRVPRYGPLAWLSYLRALLLTFPFCWSSPALPLFTPLLMFFPGPCSRLSRSLGAVISPPAFCDPAPFVSMCLLPPGCLRPSPFRLLPAAFGRALFVHARSLGFSSVVLFLRSGLSFPSCSWRDFSDHPFSLCLWPVLCVLRLFVSRIAFSSYTVSTFLFAFLATPLAGVRLSSLSLLRFALPVCCFGFASAPVLRWSAMFLRRGLGLCRGLRAAGSVPWVAPLGLWLSSFFAFSPGVVQLSRGACGGARLFSILTGFAVVVLFSLLGVSPLSCASWILGPSPSSVTASLCGRPLLFFSSASGSAVFARSSSFAPSLPCPGLRLGPSFRRCLSFSVLWGGCRRSVISHMSSRLPLPGRFALPPLAPALSAWRNSFHPPLAAIRLPVSACASLPFFQLFLSVALRFAAFAFRCWLCGFAWHLLLHPALLSLLPSSSARRSLGWRISLIALPRPLWRTLFCWCGCSPAFCRFESFARLHCISSAFGPCPLFAAPPSPPRVFPCSLSTSVAAFVRRLAFRMGTFEFQVRVGLRLLPPAFASPLVVPRSPGHPLQRGVLVPPSPASFALLFPLASRTCASGAPPWLATLPVASCPVCRSPLYCPSFRSRFARSRASGL